MSSEYELAEMDRLREAKHDADVRAALEEAAQAIEAWASNWHADGWRASEARTAAGVVRDLKGSPQ